MRKPLLRNVDVRQQRDASTEADEYGTRYMIEGALNTPDGRNPQVRTVWIIRDDETNPGFVSAYPLK